MQNKIKVLDYINFGGLILLMFCIFFKDNLNHYAWMQLPGKLHLLTLHIPIGAFLIMLAGRWLWSDTFHEERWTVIKSLVCTTAVFAGLTGILHASSGEFNSQILNYHAYGAGVFTLLTYVISQLTSLKIIDFLSGFCIIILIITGHNGGTITHGDNFLWPVRTLSKDSVQQNQNATVYQAFIEPIFAKKCISCHSVQKAKGGLILTDSINISKGGENGVVLVQGDASKSKIYTYALLPMKDDKHMPPDGKPQLSSEEIKLLRLWINTPKNFSYKISDVKASDSLYQYVNALNEIKIEKNYTFPFADKKLIDKVNNPYLSVQSLAIDNPALVARFFVAQKYDPTYIQELLKLKEQVVHIDMHNMPVTDNDVKFLNQFPNLEYLNLNNTKVSAQGLNALSGMKNLATLSCGNNKLDVSLEKLLTTLPALTDLYVDNTSLEGNFIEKLKLKFPKVKIHTQNIFNDTLALIPPTIVNENMILNPNEKIILKSNIKDAIIRYTLDGKQPDSLLSPIYKDPIVVHKSSRVRAMMTKQGWRKSPELDVVLYQSGIKPTKITLKNKPNAQYIGKGTETFVNNSLGPITNLKDQNWIAFREKPLSAEFEFDQPKKIQSVMCSFGRVIPSYVFPPTEVRIYGQESDGKYTLLSKTRPPTITQDYKIGTASDALELKTNNDKSYKKYKIEADNLAKIPSWHPGKGEIAWVFIDEIFFYE